MCILQCTFESCCVQTRMRLVSKHNHIYCQCRFCYQWEGVKKWYGKLGTKGKSGLLDTCTVFNNFVRSCTVAIYMYWKTFDIQCKSTLIYEWNASFDSSSMLKMPDDIAIDFLKTIPPRYVKFLYPSSTVKLFKINWFHPSCIASSSFSIYFAIMSVWLTFESSRNYPGTEFRGAVSTLEKNIQICAWVFTFYVKLEKWSFHVADLPRTWKKCTELKKHVKGVQNFCFC